PGEQVTVTVQRKGGVQKTYKVALVAAPAASERLARNSSGTDSTPKTSSSEGKLGISVEPLDEAGAAEEGVGAENAGLVVTAVDPDGPAAEKLIPARSGQGADIITHVNGQRVRTARELNESLKGISTGDLISLRVYRAAGGSSGSLVIRLRAAS